MAPAKKQGEWWSFDEDVCNIIPTTAKGIADSRLHGMTSIISYATEQFGFVEKKNPGANYTKNRSVAQIQQLRSELQAPKKQHKRARQDEKQSLAELRVILKMTAAFNSTKQVIMVEVTTA